MQVGTQQKQNSSYDSDVALDVEDAELSSAAELPNRIQKSRKASNQPDEDFVLHDDDDDIDDDSPYSASHVQSPDRDHIDPNTHQCRDLPNIPNDNLDRPHNQLPFNNQRKSSFSARDSANSRESSRSPGGSSRSEDSSSSADTPSSDKDDDHEDDRHSLKTRSTRKSNSAMPSADANMLVEEAQLNGDADDSDSEAQSADAVRKGSRCGSKFVIPEDLKDDGRFFRRSSRARNAPDRLSISPHESPSESVGSDSEFNADGMFVPHSSYRMRSR